MSVLPPVCATTTSRSTQAAPALRRSVARLGYDVSVTPSTTPASISVHGPWQIAATGLPAPTKAFTRACAPSWVRRVSALTVPPGMTSASKSSADTWSRVRSTG